VPKSPLPAEKIVRELSGRGLLQAQNPAYVATADVNEAKVPVPPDRHR
jgi:hypothetical protein